MIEGRAVWVTRDRAEAAEVRVKELEAEVKRLKSAQPILMPHADGGTAMTPEKLLRGAIYAGWRDSGYPVMPFPDSVYEAALAALAAGVIEVRVSRGGPAPRATERPLPATDTP